MVTDPHALHFHTCVHQEGAAAHGLFAATVLPHISFGKAFNAIRKGLTTAWALNSELRFTSKPNMREREEKEAAVKGREGQKQTKGGMDGGRNLLGGEDGKHAASACTEGLRLLHTRRGCSFPLLGCSGRPQ